MKKNQVILSSVFALIVLTSSMFIGPSENISSGEIFAWIFQKLGVNSNLSTEKFEFISVIMLNIRLPRVITAFIVGSALAVSGSSAQAVFRNPLASPYILGISAGAAFGAAFSLATNILTPEISAFICGLISVILCYYLSLKNRSVSIVSLILSGIIVSGIFTAGLAIIQFISDPFRLQTIVHWTMGNLHNASAAKLISASIPLLIGLIGLFILSGKLNLLALGDTEAHVSGVNPVRIKLIIIVFITLCTSASVAIAGIIGLLDLVIPHMVRMVFGPDNKKGIWLNFLWGGTFLLIIDNFSRTIASFEIPVGIFTMLIGAPFFILIIKKSKIDWNA